MPEVSIRSESNTALAQYQFFNAVINSQRALHYFHFPSGGNGNIYHLFAIMSSGKVVFALSWTES
jgi:hypothetical protein